jgi:hypothetical protein
MDLKHYPSTVSIDHGVTLAPVDFLAGIIAPRTTGFRGLDALAVDDCRARTGFAADTHAIYPDFRNWTTISEIYALCVPVSC